MVFEFLLDGGPWFDVTSSGSGAAFAASGCNSTISFSRPPGNAIRWPSAAGWIDTATPTEVEVNLNLAMKTARTERARWRLGTDGAVVSHGWHADDVALSGTTPVTAPDRDGIAFRLARTKLRRYQPGHPYGRS